MLKKYLKFLLFPMLLVGLFYIVAPCLASAYTELFKGVETSGVKGWGTAIVPGSTTGGLPYIIQVVISAFLGLLGIIFLVLIIYAGFEWMTAQGDEEKVTKAKDTLTRAIIGLVIITAAYSITYFVFSNLPGGPGSSGGGDESL